MDIITTKNETNTNNEYYQASKLHNYYNKNEYNKKTGVVKNYPAHWISAIFQEVSAIIYIQNPKMIDVSSITTVDPNTNLTTLAIAIILGKKNLAKLLINKYFVTQLFSNSLDQDLLRGIYQRSLKNIWLIEGSSEIKLSELSCTEVNEKLGFLYQDGFYVSSEGRVDFLQEKTTTTPTFNDKVDVLHIPLKTEEIYKNYKEDKNLPSLTLQKSENEEGIYTISTREDILPGTCLGLWSGEFKKEGTRSTSKYYELFSDNMSNEICLNGTDHIYANEIGNFTRLIPCGFPNVMVLPSFYDNDHQIKQNLIVSTDKISADQKLYIYNGPISFFQLYCSKFTLNNKEMMIDFFSNDMNENIKKLDSISANADLNDHSHVVKSFYITQIPSVLIFLHAKGLINMDKLFKSKPWILTLRQHNPIRLDLLDALKNFFTYLDKNLSEKQQIKEMIYEFILSHVEKISVIQLLHILQSLLVAIRKNEIDEVNFEICLNDLINSLDEYDWEKDKNHPLSKENVISSRITFIWI